MAMEVRRIGCVGRTECNKMTVSGRYLLPLFSSFLTFRFLPARGLCASQASLTCGPMCVAAPHAMRATCIHSSSQFLFNKKTHRKGVSFTCQLCSTGQ
jgi:hypothetical protein